MNAKRWLTILLAILMAFPLNAGVVTAQEPEPSNPSGVPADLQADFLLYLTSPDLQKIDIPASLNRRQAQELAIDLIQQQALPVLQTLDELKKSGAIHEYRVDNENGEIAVSGGDAGQLSSLQGVQVTLAAGSSGNCRDRYLSQLGNLLFLLSEGKHRPASSNAGSSSTDPLIFVRYPDQYGLTFINGYTTPNSPVTLRILRDGQLVTTQHGTTDVYGDFVFFSNMSPYTGDCSDEWYDWTAQVGDTVEISAPGKVSSTKIAKLTAWVDPAHDNVIGSTDARKRVRAYVAYGALSKCNEDHYENTGTADLKGRFLINFTDLVDFDRTAYAIIDVLDSSGHATYDFFYSPHIDLASDGQFSVYMKPDEAFRITLIRGTTTIASISEISDSNGYYSGEFLDDLLPGDVFKVTSADQSNSLQVVDFSAVLDPQSNKISGSTSPGRRILIQVQSSISWRTRNSCESKVICTQIHSDQVGTFQYTPELFNIGAGSGAYFAVFDSEGNYQSFYRTVPTLHVDLSSNLISGMWGIPGKELTIIHKDQAGSVKDTYPDELAGPRLAEFDVWLNSDLEAGDQLVVSDGTITKTMPVQNLTGMLNNSTDHLTGTASNGKLIIEKSRYSPIDTEYSPSTCREIAVSGGTFDVDFGDILAVDSAVLSSLDPDGNFTSLDAHAFQIVVYVDDGYIHGYTMTPNREVSSEIWRAGTLIRSGTTTSNQQGIYTIYLGETLEKGDQVKVIEAISSTVEIPEMSIGVDGAQNRVFGKAFASRITRATLWATALCGKGSLCGVGFGNAAWADGYGNYSISYDNLTAPMLLGACQQVRVDAPCSQVDIETFNYSMHSVVKYGPLPTSETADSFESDDTFGTAVAYMGRTSHTFHNNLDEDWIKFDVSGAEVGKTYYLATTALGSSSDTKIELYGPDAEILISSDDDSGGNYASTITFTPAEAGTYYVRILPYDYWMNATRCGARYEFTIYHYRQILPLVIR